MPADTIAPTASALAGAGGEAWAWDATTATHVQLNGDLARAEAVVQWMLDGIPPDLDAAER